MECFGWDVQFCFEKDGMFRDCNMRPQDMFQNCKRTINTYDDKISLPMPPTIKAETRMMVVRLLLWVISPSNEHKRLVVVVSKSELESHNKAKHSVEGDTLIL
ncbi:hypothetical protein Pyn_33880 [Prunus yedoensis var. nudiflora]|uniref:Uncharacterized protein n=1 Tax=Prunus yedoensis var. nudiflora TaxID=2094558 RepID=A0A314YC54_PRUYE|nr:hypothetical protein Pyn_33880 [Prunus yedoensis var. nudiflora]